MLEDILLIISGLAGLGGFVSILINVLKKIGVVKEGTSEQWFQGASMIAFVAVTVVYLIKVPVDWSQVDGWLKLLSVVLGFVIQVLGGKLTYTAVKGMPLIGYSYAVQNERALAKEQLAFYKRGELTEEQEQSVG